MSDDLTSDERYARIQRLTNPTLDEALARAADLQGLEERGHWADGVPTWCQEWADLIGTSPAMIVGAAAWRSVAGALLAERTQQSTPSSTRNEVLDLIRPVAEKYADVDTARFAIGDFLDRLRDEGYTIQRQP